MMCFPGPNHPTILGFSTSSASSGSARSASEGMMALVHAKQTGDQYGPVSVHSTSSFPRGERNATYRYAASPVGTGLSARPTTAWRMVDLTPSAPMIKSHLTTSPEASVHAGAAGSMDETCALRRRVTWSLSAMVRSYRRRWKSARYRDKRRRKPCKEN